MSSLHTQVATLDNAGPHDAWAEFRVGLPAERLQLLRELRDRAAPVVLSAADGSALGTTVWAVDTAAQRLNFSVDPANLQLSGLVDADEVVAVAYLTSVKLQFELHELVLVRGQGSCALQSTLPDEIYRFQRRGGFRVRVPERHAPLARLRHPAVPEMQLALRLLDVSIGGCALWLPHDVPPLQAGTAFGSVRIELDAETRFDVRMTLQHVSGTGHDCATGARLGCEWQQMGGPAERALQRFIDRTQQRRRFLTAPA